MHFFKSNIPFLPFNDNSNIFNYFSKCLVNQFNNLEWLNNLI